MPFKNSVHVILGGMLHGRKCGNSATRTSLLEGGDISLLWMSSWKNTSTIWSCTDRFKLLFVSNLYCLCFSPIPHPTLVHQSHIPLFLLVAGKCTSGSCLSLCSQSFNLIASFGYRKMLSGFSHSTFCSHMWSKHTSQYLDDMYMEGRRSLAVDDMQAPP